MSLTMRRTVVVLLGIGTLASLAFLEPALGQVMIKRGGPVQIQVAQPGGIQPGPGDPNEPSEFGQAIQLPTDPGLKKRLSAARDYIKEESWGEAVRILQKLL